MMFFFFAVTSDSRNLGGRFCRRFPCCGATGAIASVTCVSQKFIFFFLPLFRFGKHYFVTCPNCGAVFEIAREEGKRLEKDPRAEIDPTAMRRTGGQAARFCPGCGARVEAGMRYCPYCGRKL